MMETLCDALGNPIELGQRYGYSTASTVVIGRAIRRTQLKITIENEKTRTFLYGEENEKMPWRGNAKTVSVFSWHLFPIKD
jgi:hypothetical protein